MKKVYFILLMTILCAFPVMAQIAVGGSRPIEGAIIDLNNPYDGVRIRGGLLLSNVELQNLTHIPASGFVGITSSQDSYPALKGMMVWNINNGNSSTSRPKEGVYIWDGYNWLYIGGSD
ncbi:MAG: hypothetical protein LBQ84_01020 [Flavobacteriaceae bacterium]|jgi:hypothetical protein|nr:hypothetical protein [Flavobacteriaceae bacterium]